MGGGGGKGSQKATGGMPPELIQMIQRFETETRGLRGELIGEMTGALTGAGRPRVAMPMIGQMESASRRATSKALTETGTELARTGLAGTPFGERVMAETRQTGAQQLGAIAPTQMQRYIDMILQAAPSYFESLFFQLTFYSQYSPRSEAC